MVGNTMSIDSTNSPPSDFSSNPSSQVFRSMVIQTPKSSNNLNNSSVFGVSNNANTELQDYMNSLPSVNNYGPIHTESTPMPSPLKINSMKKKLSRSANSPVLQSARCSLARDFNDVANDKPSSLLGTMQLTNEMNTTTSNLMPLKLFDTNSTSQDLAASPIFMPSAPNNVALSIQASLSSFTLGSPVRANSSSAMTPQARRNFPSINNSPIFQPSIPKNLSYTSGSSSVNMSPKINQSPTLKFLRPMPDSSGFDVNRSATKSKVPLTPQRTPPRSPLLQANTTLFRFNTMVPSSTTDIRPKVSKRIPSMCSTGLFAAIAAIQTPNVSHYVDMAYDYDPHISEISHNTFKPSSEVDFADDYSADFSWHEELGTGSFGVVFRVCNHAGHYFAIKKALRPFPSEKARAKFLNEMQLVSTITPHQNIVLHHRAWQECGSSFLVLELCEKGNVYSYLKPNIQRNREFFMKFISDTLTGLHHMHSKNVIHMDIKPANIYYGNDGNFKYGDFGMSVIQGMPCEEGDKTYMPPEFLGTFEQRPATASADIFSLGLTYYELVCGLDQMLPASDAPYHALRHDQIPFPDNVPFEFQKLIKSMLSSDPNFRPSASVLLKNLLSS